MADFWGGLRDLGASLLGGTPQTARNTASAIGSQNVRDAYRNRVDSFLNSMASLGLSDADIEKARRGELQIQNLSGNQSPEGMRKSLEMAISDPVKTLAGITETKKMSPGRKQTLLNRDASRTNTLLTLMSEQPNYNAGQPVTLAKARGY